MRKEKFISLFAVLLIGFSGMRVEAQTNDTTIKERAAAIETQATEYFKAVVDKDYETILKYVHPYMIEDLGGKETVLESLKSGVDFLEKDEMSFVSFSVVRVDLADDKEAAIPAIVNHKSEFRVSKAVEEYRGQMKVYEFRGKNYFILRQLLIFSNFGIKEFDDDEPEKKSDPR